VLDFHGDYTSTCTAHTGACKTHVWMLSVGPLFCTAGHRVGGKEEVEESSDCICTAVVLYNDPLLGRVLLGGF
jgi:hypothetical protein